MPVLCQAEQAYLTEATLSTQHLGGALAIFLSARCRATDKAVGVPDEKESLITSSSARQNPARPLAGQGVLNCWDCRAHSTNNRCPGLFCLVPGHRQGSESPRTEGVPRQMSCQSCTEHEPGPTRAGDTTLNCECHAVHLTHNRCPSSVISALLHTKQWMPIQTDIVIWKNRSHEHSPKTL
jgi:hypothetical protein